MNLFLGEVVDVLAPCRPRKSSAAGLLWSLIARGAMKIRIATLQDTDFTIEYVVSSISFDKESGRYRMAAGGYDIAGTSLPRPVRIEMLGGVEIYTFANDADMLSFFEWVRDANSRARDSYKRMLD